ncbi:hypothetical protein BKI51_11190 [Alphaproteobacteria bacterium AO1-B]|nr:hypothetical protein BKI51_11190 [Alphaproteobacteria bacterium AO1-B]
MLRALSVLLLVLFTSTALAWEFRASRVCELLHKDETASVRVVFDSAVPEYFIAITPNRPWTPGPVFFMRFDGPFSNIIATDRHIITPGGGTLTVTDRGFGNVLDGLEFNVTATALLGDQAVQIPLDGAAPEVREFRACASGLGV